MVLLLGLERAQMMAMDWELEKVQVMVMEWRLATA